MNNRKILQDVINEINNTWWNNKGISLTETDKNNAPPIMIRELRKIFGGIYGNSQENEIDKAINEAIDVLKRIDTHNLKFVLPFKYNYYESYLIRLKSIQPKSSQDTLKHDTSHSLQKTP